MSAAVTERSNEFFISNLLLQIQSVSLESKEWVKNNRVCDAPGSWFCRGQYPPALQKILKEKKDFKQLEDFNQAGGDDSDYQREYFENLLSDNRGPHEKKDRPKKRAKSPKLTPTQIDLINEEWGDNEVRHVATNGFVHSLILLCWTLTFSTFLSTDDLDDL